MKTKFSQIVKVKKRVIDEIESQLLDAQNQRRRVELEIDDIIKEISKLKTPKSGNFSQINLSFTYLSNLSGWKKSKEQELLMVNQQIEGIKELYKEANIEYEKINYLHDQEIKKSLNELKIKEAKDMDEIANLLHKRVKLEEEA